MSSDNNYVLYICDQLKDVGEITYKKMFGEYGLYLNGKIFGLVCDNSLFIKITESGAALYPNIETAPPYDGAKPYFIIYETEDKEKLCNLVNATYNELCETSFKTKRLILRPWRETDAEELYKYAKDPEVGPMAGWSVHTSVKNSLEIIKNILSAPETYAVVLKDTLKPVGSIGIMRKMNGFAPISDTEAEIGYWIGKPYWGNGFIPEAVKEMQKHCFKDLNCTGVWCGYYDKNTKSARVQEKCGFKYHHTNENTVSPMGDKRTEHFTYISKEEWKVFYNIK